MPSSSRSSSGFPRGGRAARPGEVAWHEFRWPPHLYAALALHFGAGVLGAAISKRHPAAALALSAAAAASLAAEVSRKGLFLRRVLGSAASQNLVVSFRPAGSEGKPPARRLVLLAHADSAYTGTMFHPDLLRASLKPPPAPLAFLQKQLRLPTGSLAGLAALSAARLAGARGAWVDVATALLALPPAIVFGLNLEIVLRNHTVPGAADNVSGAVAVVELARRLAPSLPEGTELVAVITGSEEAGTGGADRLARDMESAWPRETTTVLAVDTMSNGDLVHLEEGELWRIPVPERLSAAIAATSAEDGMPAVRKFVIPAGATDALPFLARGYEAVGLTCIDPTIGAPRHYHRPSDTAENVDPAELGRSIDFAERLCRRLLAGA
jgi:Peptidase family M28